MVSRSLLVIEKDERVARFICNVAQRLGYKCTAAGVNENIEAAYQKYGPDIIILNPNCQWKQAENLLHMLAERQSDVAIFLSSNNTSPIRELKKLGDSLGLNMAGILPDILDADILKEEFFKIFISPDKKVSDITDTDNTAKSTDHKKQLISNDQY